MTDWNLKAPAGTVTTASGAAGYLMSHDVLDSFVALNRLLGANEDAYWLQSPLTANGKTYAAGTWYVAARPTTLPLLQKIAADPGVSAEATTAARPAGALRLRRPRLGLWDQYGGSMDSGWARWILEQFQFPYEKVFPAMLDAGNLNAKYDVLVFVEGGIPGDGQGAAQPAPADIPAEFRPWLGRVTADRTLPEIRKFIDNGGTVITIGESSVNLARYLKLPVEDHLVENGAPLPRTKYFVPGSVLSARIDVTHPLAHGMKERTDMFFDNSPVFKLGAGAAGQGVKPIAWFDSRTPLRSGWAWGQQYLENGVGVIEAVVGKGRVFLMGPEIIKRAQPHGTFKLLFNGLYYGAAMAPAPAGSAARGR